MGEAVWSKLASVGVQAAGHSGDAAGEEKFGLESVWTAIAQKCTGESGGSESPGELAEKLCRHHEHAVYTSWTDCPNRAFGWQIAA